MTPVPSSFYVDWFCEENGMVLAVCSDRNLGLKNLVFEEVINFSQNFEILIRRVNMYVRLNL